MNSLTCRPITGVLTLLIFLLLAPIATSANATTYQCEPTPADEVGPLYKPNAPVRNRVGTGYMLFGTVKSAMDCQPLPRAKIEIWLAGPMGHYGDAWRATLFTNENGTYHFQSHVPPSYGTGRAHIHIQASIDGFQTLATQHYPAEAAGEALVDLVLVPMHVKQ